MAVELVLKRIGSVSTLHAIDAGVSRSLGRGPYAKLAFVRSRVAGAIRATAKWSPIGALAPREADLEDATLAAIGADEAWATGRRRV